MKPFSHDLDVNFDEFVGSDELRAKVILDEHLADLRVSVSEIREEDGRTKLDLVGEEKRLKPAILKKVGAEKALELEDLLRREMQGEPLTDQQIQQLKKQTGLGEADIQKVTKVQNPSAAHSFLFEIADHVADQVVDHVVKDSLKKMSQLFNQGMIDRCSS